MNYGGAGAAAAAAHQAKIQATKAFGAIVKMNSAEFLKIVNKSEQPLVVFAKSWLFGTKFNYLTNYRGLFFYTSSPEPLNLPGKVEIIAAEKIWVPS